MKKVFEWLLTILEIILMIPITVVFVIIGIAVLPIILVVMFFWYLTEAGWELTSRSIDNLKYEKENIKIIQVNTEDEKNDQ